MSYFISPKTRKLSKIEAFRKAFEIIRDSRANQDDAGELLHHFAPAQSRYPKTMIEWVRSAAAGKNEKREHLRYINVTTDHIMATDGSRLHMIANSGRAAGKYSPEMERIGDSSEKYPDAPGMIDRALDTCTLPLDLVDAEVIIIDHKDKILEAYVWKIEGEKHAINRRYMDEAMAGRDCTIKTEEYHLGVQYGCKHWPTCQCPCNP
jgi:hypothetical protein